MFSFKNDYSETAHPNIIAALQDSNGKQFGDYGIDVYCDEAKMLISKAIQNDKAEIHFATGGTQANLIVISSLLKNYESVVAASSGHIAVHEAGAIEFTGHKINTIETDDGKITIEQIQSVLDFHTDEHMVKPKLVYISNSTELGTIYSKQELTAISKFCKDKNLLLYMDGARLASALTAKTNDLSLADIANLVDVFYIGGTKNGALFGEAIVLLNNQAKEDFRFQLKQKGALLAKGAVLGIQFVALFKNNLFFDLGKHANAMAEKLTMGITNAGFSFYTKPISNMIFPILPNTVIEKLNQQFDFYIWKQIDETKSIIRLVTSWATDEKNVDEFVALIKNS